MGKKRRYGLGTGFLNAVATGSATKNEQEIRRDGAKMQKKMQCGG